MELLWGSPVAQSAYEIRDQLAASGEGSKLAATTVLTVLSRLEKKGFVARERSARPHRFLAAASREDHMAELMHEVLGSASDRVAVLERFVGQATPSEADALRKLLAR
jgi:predicted transcriptional regulator